jgi:hypothetical protein
MDFPQGPSLCRAFAAAVMVLGCAVPMSAGARMLEWEALAVLVPEPGCGTAPTVLLGRVAAHRPSHTGRHRPGRQQAEVAPATEPLPSLRRAYYTCTSTPLTAMPAGAGWLAVGPVRRG